MRVNSEMSCLPRTRYKHDGTRSLLQFGQRVLCLHMQGGLFRHVVHVPRKNCFTLPSSVSLADSIALGLDFLVAHVCLFQLGGLRKGQVVFMQSLGGGVGTAVAQLARTVPYVTVLGTASESKHDKLWCLGVNRIYRHEDNYVERILRMYPEGADVVIVRSGGTDTEKNLKLLKPCGRLVTIGSDSTVTYPRTMTMALKRPTWETKYISTAELVNKNVIVVGLNIGDFIENNTYQVQTILDNVLELHFQDRMKPHIHSMRSFEKVADALELLCRRQNFGKVVLLVQDEDDHTVAFGRRVPSPPKPIPGAVTWESLQQRVHYKVVSKRKLKYLEKKAEDSPEEAQEEQDGEEDESFTEYEASMAEEMIKAISESEASQNTSF